IEVKILRVDRAERKIGHPNEILEKGQKISCQVLSVDQERKRIALGRKQLKQDPWETEIPERYSPGDTVNGKVTKLTNFGVFVELEPGLEGLLHISELADHKVDSPEEVVNVGDDIEVKILRVDRTERKIGLSRKKAGVEGELEEDAEPGESTTAVTQAAGATRAEKEQLKGGLGGGGPLFSLGGSEAPAEGEAVSDTDTAETQTPEVETPGSGAANDGGQPDETEPS
ncbi:MAG TPA: S1 RNA-binding domain-containing protein, partial [Isosphaeraceae bacterium]|nr:S1 RNA-binding domain-containing protein [Isosphaeraceae bacterium]